MKKQTTINAVILIFASLLMSAPDVPVINIDIEITKYDYVTAS